MSEAPQSKAKGATLLAGAKKLPEHKLAKLATKKCQLDFANQVQLIELESVDLRGSGTPRKTLTVNTKTYPSLHRQQCQ